MGVRRRTAQRQQQRAAKAGGAPSEATPSKASRSSSQNETPSLSPSLEEVFHAVDSLYADDLKPFGRILRKRVAERAIMALGLVAGGEENLPDVDHKHLQTVCEASSCLRVEPEEGGDWSALIVGRCEAFVNVYSPLDLYPPAMWETAATYFQALTGDDVYLPGGRYSCAQALQARELPFLQGRSLGQVCHIVQLAISQKKILGYLNGAVVPYARSQSMVKEQCAQFNAPCTVPATTQASSDSATGTGAAASGSGLVMATWETARQCLADVLDTAAKASGTVGMVPLSNVKRLFRSRFHTELSETMLGHSKLSELLQDERFSDVCTVQLRGYGYIVMQAQAPENQTICLADTLPMYGGETPASEPRRVKLAEDQMLPQFCPEEPLTLEMDEAGVYVESSPSPKIGRARWPPADSNGGLGLHNPALTKNTFIHASPPPPTPPPNARRRSVSLPKDVGSGNIFWEPKSNLSLGFMAQPAQRGTEGTESGISTIDSAAGSFADAFARAPPSPSLSCEQSCRSDQSAGPALDDPVKVLLRECNLGAATEPVRMNLEPDQSPCNAEDAEPRRRLLFCPDEPLDLERAGIFFENGPATQTPTPAYNHPGLSSSSGSMPRRQACLSPNAFAKDARWGSVPFSKIQNTFLHSPLPLPTPLRVGASRRARSLPKNVGSDKNAFEAMCQGLGWSQAVPRIQPELSAADCGPTPSVYGGYADMACSLSPGLPAFVPPSPALTASPTYCTGRQLGLPRAQRPALIPTPTGSVSPSRSPARQLSPRPMNVICLADLLH